MSSVQVSLNKDCHQTRVFRFQGIGAKRMKFPNPLKKLIEYQKEKRSSNVQLITFGETTAEERKTALVEALSLYFDKSAQHQITDRKDEMMTTTFAELDTNAIQRGLNKLLKERYGADSTGAFVLKLFPDYCIYKIVGSDGNPKLYKASYGAAGMKLTLSEKPIEVAEQTEYVPVKPETSQATNAGVNFNATPGIELDQDSVKFSEAAAARASKKNIPLGAAMSELTKGRVDTERQCAEVQRCPRN